MPIAIAAALTLSASLSPGATLFETSKLVRAGQYAESIKQCDEALAAGAALEDWWVLKLRSQLAMGAYADALVTFNAALEAQPRSIQVRFVGRDVLRANDRPVEAEQQLEALLTMAAEVPYRYGSAEDRVTIGRALLALKQDARLVLERVYDPIKRSSPSDPGVHLATGQLALEKNDLAIAAEAFETAARLSPDDPDAHFGLAVAYSDSDSPRAAASLARALELNPKHVDSLLLQVDRLISRESYDQAFALIDQVRTVNPRDARASAYAAAIAHLNGDRVKEDAARAEALSSWRTNPEVDHLIGKSLSQRYRFAEGRARQEQALAFDPTYRPAKEQLCQDLLRLGLDEQGWKVADELFAQDPYNVLAYNLTTLRDELSKYRTIRTKGFRLRMDPREADLYGRRAADLLAEAAKALGAKYGVTLPAETVVEIFPRQQDFAIRTFGLPGGAGYLGVCFGPVITVNSPASRRATPANWEAVLWHEFCHTVTLTKTKNKMPRWLSEGISVYEEGLRNPAWGQSMNPRYRARILESASPATAPSTQPIDALRAEAAAELGDDRPRGATPVSQLSGAFLNARSPLDVQFAYYQSSMVVKYVVERFGIDAVRAVLSDLANDVPINDALARHTEPIERLDASFDAWFREQAKQLAPGADWARPDVPLDADSTALAAWNRSHPNNIWGLLAEGQALLAEGKPREALAPLQRAADLYPTLADGNGPFLLLAMAHRSLGDVDAERDVLQRHASIDADAVEPRLRLLELLAAASDWPAVKRYAEEVLAVNPLIAAPHRFLAQACDALGDRKLAIEARRTVLLLGPPDRVDQNYRLARSLAAEGQHLAAKEALLAALEEAPRFRDAHRLLLEVVDKVGPTTAPGVDSSLAPTGATERTPSRTLAPATTAPVERPSEEVPSP